MAKDNLTKSADLQVKPREIDFVTRFARNWEHLREILGVMRPIRKEPGAVLKSKKATLVLQDGNIGEGEEIPYSKAKIDEIPYQEMTVEKYAKAVSIESIKDHGYDVAVQQTDDAFLFELQTNVTSRFYAYLNTGTLRGSYSGLQMAMAMAKGAVENKFKKMHRTVTGVVGFANIMDIYKYIGSAELTIQNEFGFQYIKNFLGFNTIFLLSDDEIAQGKFIATPVENIVLYYVDPSTSDFARAGLSYTTDGETNLIGFHTEGNYHTAVSESFAIMGMTLFAEYIDAIAVISFTGPSVTPPAPATLKELTVASAAGTSSGTTKITVSPAKASGNVYKYKVADAATTVTYGQNVQTWTAWNGTADITAESGKTITLVEADADYKAVGSGTATVVSNV